MNKGVKLIKIVYIGGFEMPDGNAAAQRVLSIAKALQYRYEVKFLGLTHSDNYQGVVSGFEYENLPYPKSKKEWIRHLAGSRELQIVKKECPDIVIAYNYPSLGLWRMKCYCKNNKIKLLGDVTEWYHPHNAIKWLDTEWRMRILHKKIDGLIVISSYLEDYYSKNKVVTIPPTVDLQSPLWNNRSETNNSLITLLYVGSPGRGDKDKLDTIIDTVTPYANLKLVIVGISVEQYRKIYIRENVPNNVAFVGRLSHEEAVNELKKADFSIFFREPTRPNNAGFPTKYAEATAAGIPVITNCFSDLPKIVIQGKNGYIAENTPASIRDTVGLVAQMTKDQVRTMKQYCMSHNEIFDFRYYSKVLEDFIETVYKENS